jgi:hypothetical protein
MRLLRFPAALTASDAVLLHRFHGASLSPSYAICSLLKAVTEIEALSDENRELDARVDRLNATVSRLTRASSTPQVRQAQSAAKFPVFEPALPSSESLRVAGSTKLASAKRNTAFLSTPRAFNYFASELIDALGTADGVAEQPSRPQVTMNCSTSHLPMLETLPGFPQGIDPPMVDAPREYGICARVGERSGGNPAELGVMTIRGNSYDAARDRLLSGLVDYTWSKCWTSKNEPESWVEFDFSPMTVLVARYSIKTYPLAMGFSHLQSWVLLCSGDGGHSWSELDRRENTNDLNGKSKIGFFALSRPVPARAIRIKQIGVNHAKDHYLILTNVEFYGEIIADE